MMMSPLTRTTLASLLETTLLKERRLWCEVKGAARSQATTDWPRISIFGLVRPAQAVHHDSLHFEAGQKIKALPISA